MQMSLTLMLQVLQMFLLAGIGYAMYRAGKISLEGNKSIGNILIYLSLPAVIIKGFMVERTPQSTFELLVSLAFGTLAVVVSAVVSRLAFRRDNVASFAATFSNPSFFGIPLVTSILGAGAVFYMTGFIAAMNIGQWTYGVQLLTGRHERLSLRQILCAPFVVATLVGLFFFATQLSLPPLLQGCLDFVGDLNTPLAMFGVGVYLAQVDLLAMLKKASNYRVALMRLVVVPLVAILLLSLLPAEFRNMKLAILVAAACPVGSNVAVYAQLYDSDYAYAVQTIVISVLLCVVSIPLVVGLAQLLW
ncbi:MAG: AEC family transporter [Coriobacteriales bacterium]|nr:AEC family transporter [Coriobacteriales bacterium]